jgi:hypothetical protein
MSGFYIDNSILSPPPSLPALKTLETDLELQSQPTQDFLLRNPTITKLIHRRDFMDIGTPIRNNQLPSHILPDLEKLQTDIYQVAYFASGRPLSCVKPIFFPKKQYPFAGDNPGAIVSREIDFQIQSLQHSTADGGIKNGGGVKIFTLGCNYSLDRLHTAMPNLEHLYLRGTSGVEDLLCTVFNPSHSLFQVTIYIPNDYQSLNIYLFIGLLLAR